ncbi:FAD-binding oxidoreductase [Alphaproteobacteria bacterium]|nr:FAD-binding oxidoreductase [Alphaproteobacteria bacterium]
MNKSLIISKLKKYVKSNNLISNQRDLEKFNKDWRGFYNFDSICAVFPETIEEIQNILIYCNKNNIKIVPQAGNTSLTGASVPSQHEYEVILNTNKMNKIIKIDKNNLTLTTETGVSLDVIRDYADKHNLFFPISLSSSGSCLIGGNIATNAGGINALKYGSMRDNLIGIEVILADGSLVNSMSSMKKNNTGYDLINIFCGSEGTLGIITKAILKIYPKPADYFHCFFAFNSIEANISLFQEIRGLFGDKLESAEIIPDIAFELSIKHGFLTHSFFNKKFSNFLLCKFSLFENKETFQKFFLDKITEINNKFEDVIFPQSLQQEKNFWKFRDDLVEAYKLEGKYITNDISIPLNNLVKFIDIATKKINKVASGTRIYSFGHLGDGNIHFNMIEPINYKDNFNDVRSEIYGIVNDLVEGFGGSFSAEHGIGMIKKKSLDKYKSANELDLMKKIKNAIDPNNILNPGKIFDLS